MKKRNIRLGLFLSLVLVLGACQSEAKPEESHTYRTTFTKEEKDKGSAKFELMENVLVDAKITPTEKYSGGLKKYYMETYFEAGNDIEDREKFKKNLLLFGKKIPEIQKLIEKEMGGKFVGKPKFEEEEGYDDVSLSQKFQRGDDTYDFWINWYFDDALWKRGHKRINCPYLYLDVRMPQERSSVEDTIRRFCSNYRDMPTPFIKDREAQAEKLQAFLAELTGREIADDYDFIPVTKESVKYTEEAIKSTFEDRSGLEKDYGTFWFYADVDGLPFKDLQLLYNMKEGETAGRIAHAGSPSDTSTTLVALSESKQEVIISENGITNLNTTRFRMAGDVYKDTAKVLDPDRILKKIKTYYERMLSLNMATVTDIKLAYTGYFTDGSEGEIQLSVAPFWVVNVYVGGETGTAMFVYDAFTGEAIKEGVQPVC